MSLGALQDESDLRRWLENELRRADVLPAGGVPASVIVTKTITGEQIAAGTITGDLIVSGAITGGLIAAETIEGKHIKAGTITAASIEAESITTKLLAAEAVTAAKIKAGTITATEIAAGTITAAKLSVSELSAITANLGNITAGTIAGTTITGGTIRTAAAGARVELTAAGIKGINAAAVTKFNFDTATGILSATAVISAEEGSTIPTKVLAGQIKETQIEEGAISTPLLAANSVVASKIAAETITGSKIAAGAITAEKLNVAELSALTSNLGTVTAGEISGVTLKLIAATTTTPPNDRKIRWVTEAESLPAGELVTIHDATTDQVRIESYLREGRAEAYARFRASDPATAREARIQCMTAPGTSSAQVTASTDVHTVTLTNRTEQSSFLQLTALAKRKINFGTALLEWPGGSPLTKELEISHGLGTKPAVVLATCAGPHLPSTGGSATYTETKFKARVRTGDGTSPAAGSKEEITWIVIG